jgi:hypothetical protein
MQRLLDVALGCQCVRIEDCFIEDCAGVNTNAGSGLVLVPLRAQPVSVRRARPAPTAES